MWAHYQMMPLSCLLYTIIVMWLANIPDDWSLLELEFLCFHHAQLNKDKKQIQELTLERDNQRFQGHE